MNLKSVKDIWDYIKKEYEENERTKNMQILNLILEFEMLKMKKAETMKEYTGKLLDIVNKLRILGNDIPDERIVRIFLAYVPLRYE